MSEMRNPIHYEETIVSFGAGVISNVKSDIQHELGNKHNYVLWAVNYRPDKIAQSFVKRNIYQTTRTENQLKFINNCTKTYKNTINIPIEIVGTLELYKFWNIFNEKVKKEKEYQDAFYTGNLLEKYSDIKNLPISNLDEWTENKPLENMEIEIKDDPDYLTTYSYNTKDKTFLKEHIYLSRKILSNANEPEYSKTLYSTQGEYDEVYKNLSLVNVRKEYENLYSYNRNGAIVYDTIASTSNFPKLLSGHQIKYTTVPGEYFPFITIEYTVPKYKLYMTQVELYGAIRYEVNKPFKTGNLFIFCNKKHSTAYTIIDRDDLQEGIFNEEENYRIYDILLNYKEFVDKYRKHAIKNELLGNYIPYTDIFGRTSYYKGTVVQLQANEVKIINQYDTTENDTRYKFNLSFYYGFGKGIITQAIKLKDTGVYESDISGIKEYSSNIVYSLHNLPFALDSPNPIPQLFKIYGLMNNHIKNGNAIYLSTLKNELEKVYPYNAPVNCYYYDDAKEMKYVFMPYDVKAATWSGWKWRNPSILYKELVGEVTAYIPKKYRLSPYLFNPNRSNIPLTSNKITKYKQFYYSTKKSFSDIFTYTFINWLQKTGNVSLPFINMPIDDSIFTEELLKETVSYNLRPINNSYGDGLKEKSETNVAEFDKSYLFKNNDYIYIKNEDTKIDIMFWMTDELPYPEHFKLRDKALMEIPINYGKNSNAYSLCDVILPFGRYSDLLNNYILTIEELNHEKKYWIPYQSIKYPRITKNNNHHIGLFDMISNRKNGILNIDPRYLIYEADGIYIELTDQTYSASEIRYFYQTLMQFTPYDALYYPLNTVTAKLRYNNTKESVTTNIVPALQNVCRNREMDMATYIEIEDEMNEKEIWTDYQAQDYDDLVYWREVIGTDEEYRDAGIPTMSATALMLPNYKANETPRYWLRGEEIPYLITGVVDGIEIEFKRGVYTIPSSNEFVRFKHPALYIINYDKLQSYKYRLLHYIEENSMMSCNPNSIMYAYHPFAWSNVVPSTKALTVVGNARPPHIMNTLNNKLKKNGLHKLFSFEYEYEDNGDLKHKSTKLGQFTFYPMWQRFPFLCFTLILNYSSLEEAINDLPSGLTQIKLYIAEASSNSIINRDIRGKEASVFEEGYAKHNIKNNRNGYRLVKTFTIKNTKGDTIDDYIYNRMITADTACTDTNSWLRVQNYTDANVSWLSYDDINRQDTEQNSLLSKGYDYLRKKSFLMAIPYIDIIEHNYEFKDITDVEKNYNEYSVNLRNDTNVDLVFKKAVKWTPDFYVWDYPQQTELAIDNLQGMGDQLWDGIGSKYVTTIKNAFVIIEGQDKEGNIETGRIRISLNQNGKFSHDIFRKWDYIDVCTEEITSFAVFKDNLILFTKNSIYLVVFQDITNSATWYVANKIDHPGALHEKNVAVSKDGVYFCNREGVYVTDGIDVACISTQIDDYYKKNFSRIIRKTSHQLPLYYEGLKTESAKSIDRNAKIILDEEYYSIPNSVELLYNDNDKCLYVVWNGLTIHEFVYNTELKIWHIEEINALQASIDNGCTDTSIQPESENINTIDPIESAPKGTAWIGLSNYYIYNNLKYYIEQLSPYLVGQYITKTDNDTVMYEKVSYGIGLGEKKQGSLVKTRLMHYRNNLIPLLRTSYIFDGRKHKIILYDYDSLYTPVSPFCGYGFNVTNYNNMMKIHNVRPDFKIHYYKMYAGSYGYKVVNEISESKDPANISAPDNFIIDYCVLNSVIYDVTYEGDSIFKVAPINVEVEIKTKPNLEIISHDVTNGIEYYALDELLIELSNISVTESSTSPSSGWQAIKLDRINILQYQNIIGGLYRSLRYKKIISLSKLPEYNTSVQLYLPVIQYKDTIALEVWHEKLNMKIYKDYSVWNINYNDMSTYKIRIVPTNDNQILTKDVIKKIVSLRAINYIVKITPQYKNSNIIDYKLENIRPNIGTVRLVYNNVGIRPKIVEVNRIKNGQLTTEKTMEVILPSLEVDYQTFANYILIDKTYIDSNEKRRLFYISKDEINYLTLKYPLYFNLTNNNYHIHISSYCFNIIECIKLQGRIYEKSNYS